MKVKDDKNTDISERILKVIDYFGVSRNDFALTLGYDRSQTIYDIVNRKSKPSFDFFQKFMNSEFSEQINLKWLFTGLGEMKNVNLNVNPSVNLNQKIAPNTAPNPEIAAEPSSKYIGVPQVVTVDSLGNENIPFVRSKAAAGYVGSFMQPEYVSNLPTYRLP